ncbi:MAG TPA: extracellular solute-binding protein [Clostridiales bacterium]|nr:extracellular solute-binding protein [Clostridiales bacterium]
MKRKTIAIFLAVVMIIGITAGCAGTKRSPDSSNKEKTTSNTAENTVSELEQFSPMTFTTVTTSQEAASNPNTDLFAKALREKFNITLKIDYIAQSSLAETMKLRMAGNEDPDVHFNLFGDFDKYGVDGYFIAFDDYFDKLPNYRAQWPDEFWQEYLELATAPDGKYYSLRVPMGNVQLVGEGWLFRMSTIEELGVKAPETTQELYSYLKAIKNKYPDSIPISNRNGLWGLTRRFEDAFRTSSIFQYDGDYNKFVYEPITDKYRDMLIYLNKLYKEDLISKEFSTQSAQQWSEHVGQGKVHVLLEYFAREGWANNLCTEVDPKANWLSSPKFINAYPDKKLMVSRYSAVGASSARISSRNSQERIDRLIKVFDWLATEEGMIKTQMGEEGVTFKYNSNNEIEYMDNIITPLNPDKGTDTLLKYNLEYRIINYPRFFYYQGGGPSTVIGDLVRKNNYDYFKPYSLVFNDAEKATIADFGTVVNDKMAEYTLKFIMSQLDPTDNATWKTYVETINKNGLEKILPVYQKAYEEKYGK